ncbi:MAG: ATP-binding protein [Oscillospiraceae bacterium]|nr:ATP-binding protein [Oscillospiraceae bacterium]
MENAQQQLHHERSRYFVRGAFRRFFLPALFSSFWMAVAGVVDSVFVGNGIGTGGLAAIGFGQPVYLFYNILSYGFSIGGSIHYASRLAEGREEEGNRIFHTILQLLLTVYIVTAALGLIFLPQLMRLLGADPADELTRSYIQTQLIFVPVMFCQGPFYYFVNADNGPKTAALAMSASGILDTVFSYIFIIQMGLGVRGSVYSTVVGATVMLGVTGRHIVKRRGALRFGWAKAEKKIIGAAARTGFATALQYLYQFVTMIAVNRLLMRLGGGGAVAAFDVVYNISLLCASITDGTNMASEPMLSSYRSERNLGNVRITLSLALLWAGIASAALAGVFALFAPQFAAIFGMRMGAGAAYAATGIRVFALSILPAMVNVVFGGYYQAILREWLAYLITFLRSFVFYLLALALLARGGMDTFWYVFAASEVLALAVWIPTAMARGGFLQLRGIDVSNARSVTIDQSSQEISAVVEQIQEFCEERDTPPKKAMHIGLAIEEVCCAIVEHCKEHMDDIYIQVTVVAENGETTLFLRDNAFAYNPLGANVDADDLTAEQQSELLGIRIVQKTAKEFYYRRYSGFNTLVIRL